MQELLSRFFEDDLVQILLLVVALDFALGVIAAVVSEKQDFRLAYVADFARNDLLGKAVPFLIIYGGYVYAGSEDLVIPGLDLQVVMYAVWGIIMAAMAGSVLNSLRELGLGEGIPAEIAGPDPTTPTPPPNA